MRLKQFLSLALCMLFASTGAALAAPPDFNNKAQMRQFMMDSCQKEATECVCLADKFSSNLTAKEWSIFIAAVNKAAEPPANVSDSELSQFTNKLSSLINSCKP